MNIHPNDTYDQTAFVLGLVFDHLQDRGVVTLEEERSIDSPNADCGRHDDPISIPNRNAENLYQHPIWIDDSIEEWLMRTYMRRTTNNEEANIARKLKAWKRNNERVLCVPIM